MLEPELCKFHARHVVGAVHAYTTQTRALVRVCARVALCVYTRATCTNGNTMGRVGKRTDRRRSQGNLQLTDFFLSAIVAFVKSDQRHVLQTPRPRHIRARARSLCRSFVDGYLFTFARQKLILYQRAAGRHTQLTLGGWIGSEDRVFICSRWESIYIIYAHTHIIQIIYFIKIIYYFLSYLSVELIIDRFSEVSPKSEPSSGFPSFNPGGFVAG